MLQGKTDYTKKHHKIWYLPTVSHEYVWGICRTIQIGFQYNSNMH